MRFYGPAVAAIAALVLLTAAGASPALGSRSDVPNWPYIVYRPANLSKTNPVPLVIYPTLLQPRAPQDFEAAADRFGFVLVWAQIDKSYDDVVRSAGGEDPSNPYPDMLFLSSVIDKVTASENIDPTRVLMTGMSASGTLSYRAACVLANKLTAIAPVEAVVENPNCHPSRPVSLFAVNGTADPASPYNGGLGFPSVSTIMNSWRGYDSCPATATTKTLSNTSTSTTWGPCQSGTVVTSTTVNGGGHGWPTTTGIARFDATTVISSWFMSLHAASTPPATSLSAKLVSAVVKAGKPRTIVVRLSSNLAAAGRVTLTLVGKTVYSRQIHVKSGAANIALALPAALHKGTYRLAVTLTNANGAATMRRTVHIPR